MINKDPETGINVITDVFKHVYDFDELYKSYLQAAKHKRTRLDVMEFCFNLESNLLELQNELMWKTYKVSPYHSFYVTEPKLRLVMAQKFRDRVVNWAIYRQLYPYYDKIFIEDSYACRINKGTLKAANRLQHWMRSVDRKPSRWYYLKFDISKYFYRIDHAVLTNILRRRIKDRDMLWLLDVIINSETQKFGLPAGMSPEECTHDMWLSDVGIPIGNLTSQLFANIILNELDQFVKHQLKARYYVRYMDDGIILSNSKEVLKEFLKQIQSFLVENLHLDLNNKTRIAPCKNGIEFVGYRIWPTHRILKKQASRRMIRHAKKLRSLASANLIDRKYLNNYLVSLDGMLNHCDSMGLKTKIFNIFEDIKCDIKKVQKQ